MEIGSVFGRGLSALGRHFDALAGSALLVYAPFFAVELYASTLPPGRLDDFLGEFLRLSPLVLLGPLAAAVVVQGVYRHLNALPVTFEECWRGLGSAWLPVFGASLLIALASSLGYVFCLVPGFFIQTGLFVAVPALVVERLSVRGALERSWRLTRGYRLKVFFLLLGVGLVEILGFVPVLILVVALRLDQGVTNVVIGVGGSLVQALAIALQAVVASVLYFDLRRIREETGAGELAAIPPPLT